MSTRSSVTRQCNKFHTDSRDLISISYPSLDFPVTAKSDRLRRSPTNLSAQWARRKYLRCLLVNAMRPDLSCGMLPPGSLSFLACCRSLLQDGGLRSSVVNRVRTRRGITAGIGAIAYLYILRLLLLLLFFSQFQIPLHENGQEPNAGKDDSDLPDPRQTPLVDADDHIPDRTGE